MRIKALIRLFLNGNKSGGAILIFCTFLSLVLANSGIGKEYAHFWHIHYGGRSIQHWINDGLMTIFFLQIGLEIEKEIYEGKLSNIREALLPFFAAVGGIIVPAAIYLLCNYGTETQKGTGIPMATDIAFALGVLALLGSRVPLSLKVFLTSLAVIDDVGAILIIAIFYTKTLLWNHLLFSLGIFALLLVFNRLKVKNLIPYIVGGVTMWYFMLNSGIHASIAGVVAFAIPFRNGSKTSASHILKRFLVKPVAFFILPVFALANTAIILGPNIGQALSKPYGIGIACGLIIGKPLGIFLLSLLSVKLGLCKLPEDIKWKSILWVGFLGGIGFTMSIFISHLAFDDKTIINNATFTILMSSLVAGLVGFFSLKMSLKRHATKKSE